MTEENSIPVDLLKFYRRSKYLFFVIITNNMAQIMLGKVLIAESNSLHGIATSSRYKFLDANTAIGRLRTKPNPVATKAIFNVSTIPM